MKNTIALYEQIQADQLEEFEHTTLPTEASSTEPELSAPLLFEVLGHLTHLQEALADLQNQVQQSIQTVETALNNHTTPAYLETSR